MTSELHIVVKMARGEFQSSNHSSPSTHLIRILLGTKIQFHQLQASTTGDADKVVISRDGMITRAQTATTPLHTRTLPMVKLPLYTLLTPL